MKIEETNDRNLTNENATNKIQVKKAMKEGRTKGALITGIISLAVLIATGLFIYSVYNRNLNEQMALMDKERNNYNEQLMTRDSTINDWLMTFDQIEKNLNLIKQKENLITVNTGEQEYSGERKAQILEDIKIINTLMEENKTRIAQLNAQLKKSGGEITGLKSMIAELEASMKIREDEISELKLALVNKDSEIGQLNVQMADLQETVTQKDEMISEQTVEINTAFVVSGTYKDLKEKGLLSKEGGFLGLGAKESLVEDFSDSLFARVDITEMKTIPVNSKSVKFITEHPSGSYDLIHEGEDLIAAIEIKDPDQFWKISRYAVVEIGK